MIKTNSLENTKAFSGSLWFAGKKSQAFARVPQTARAREIAKSREELLGLLKDLPESDYELSLTDLVQKDSASNVTNDKVTHEVKENNSVVQELKKKKRISSRKSFASSEGVLLNVYIPASLTRSLTSCSSRGSSRREIVTDCSKTQRKKNKSASSAGQFYGKERDGHLEGKMNNSKSFIADHIHIFLGRRMKDYQIKVGNFWLLEYGFCSTNTIGLLNLYLDA